jgi:cytochrome c
MKTVTRIAKMGLPLVAFLAVAACSGGEKAPEAPAADTNTTAAAPAADAPAADPAAAGPVTFASLTGSAEAGEKVFKQCMACHSVKAGENKVGPSMNGIVGRPAGQVAGYNYSAANKNSGKTWDEETMFAYLEAPQRAIPGTKMAFAGLKKPQDRADVIAYLKLQK